MLRGHMHDMVGWLASCGMVDDLVWHTSSNIEGLCCSCSESVFPIGMFKCLLASDTVESRLGASRYPRANATFPLLSPTLIIS